MSRRSCPHCGSDMIQKNEVDVRIRVQRITAWNEDGTPADLAEPYYVNLNADAADVDEEELLDGKPYDCAQCGAAFSSIDELDVAD